MTKTKEKKLTPGEVCLQLYNKAESNEEAKDAIRKYANKLPLKERFWFVLEAIDYEYPDIDEEVTVAEALRMVMGIDFVPDWYLERKLHEIHKKFQEQADNLWKAIRSHKHHEGRVVRDL